MHDHRVCAECTDPIRLVRRGGQRDNVSPGKAGELHRVHAESPAGAGHQCALPSGQPADLADGVEDGADSAGDDRGVLKRHLLGYERDVVVLDRDIFSISADQSPVASKLSVWTQRLASAPAVTAGTADVIALDGRDAIVLAEAAHVTANLDHGSGDFVS